MFCPKCGEKIPDGIAFCPKCGNKLAVESSPTKAVTAHIETPAKAPTSYAVPGPAKPAISVPSTSLNTNVIVPLAIGVIAIILAFMPWFSLSASDFQSSQYISDGANNLSSFFGGDSAAGEVYRLKSSYTILESGDFLRTAEAYGSSNIELGKMVIGWVTLMWAIPVIVSAIGLVIAFKEKGGYRAHWLFGAFRGCPNFCIRVYELLRPHLSGSVLRRLNRHDHNDWLRQKGGLTAIFS